MRRSIRLDDDLLREAKTYAIAIGRALTRLITTERACARFKGLRWRHPLA